MLTPKQIEKLPENLVKLYAKAEADILMDMARRISTYSYFIPAAEHQYKKAIEMGLMHDEIVKKLSSITGISKKEIENLMQEAGSVSITADDEIYRQAGLNPQPIGTSKALSETMTAGIVATEGLFDNLTRTTAKTATRQFEVALDRVYMQIVSGAFDYNSSIRMAVKSLSEKGVAVIEYPSGHVDHMEVAVRRATVTGINQTAAKMQEVRADEMDSDLVETTAHGGARPTHAVWQGKVFSRSGKHPKYPDFVSGTGYGTGAGLCGWNCRHNFFPFFEGISSPAYTKKMLEEYEAKNYEYNGQKMTEYEATQKQRYIERQIRRWKRENLAMQAAGQDVVESASKIAHWEAIEKDFLKQTDLKKQSDRSQIAGFGKSNAGKVKSASVKKYNEISELIGKEKMPKTIEDFNKLGYNNTEYKDIKKAQNLAKQEKWEKDIAKHQNKEYKIFYSAKEIPDWIRNQVTIWGEDEKEALIYYTGHEYTKINKFLRGRESAGEKIKQKIESISSAIKKSNLQENISVWRGTHFRNFKEGDWLKGIPIEKWEGLQISDSAFASTSLIKDSAFNAEVLLKINIAAGSNGAYLGEVSQFKHEKELLLNKGAVFRIIRAEEREGNYFIEVEYGGE